MNFHGGNWCNFPVTVRCNSSDCPAGQLLHWTVQWKITRNSPRKSNGQSVESSVKGPDSSHNATGLQMYGSRGTNTSHEPVPTARLRSASPAYSTDSGLAGGDTPRPLAASQQWKQSPLPIINTVSNPNSPHSLQSQLNTQSSI